MLHHLLLEYRLNLNWTRQLPNELMGGICGCYHQPMHYDTAVSRISKRRCCESMRARQPSGSVNCGAVCPKSISVMIGNEYACVRSRMRSRSDSFSASE